MDCSIVPVAGRPGMLMVSTHDFFYPLVEDPYLQGRVACANVLSDLYSMGVQHCTTMLMTLAASRDMAPEHRFVVTREMMRGFNDLAREAGTTVTGGQTVLNPWPIIGGIAMAVCGEVCNILFGAVFYL
jgi:selenide,water dikinase